MPITKPILIIASCLTLLSCHKTPAPAITTTFEFELLHGQVKQLREMYRGDKSDISQTDITDFDIHGTAIQTKKTGSSNSLIKYEYRYDKTGNKIGLITNDDESEVPFICRFDTKGRIVQRIADPKALEPDPYNRLLQEKFFYTYNAAGDRIQADYYSDDDLLVRATYRYNDRHLLIEEDYLPGGDEKKVHKTFYHYTSFDSKGNWLRRVGEVKSYGPPVQEIGEPVVVRRLTYY